MTPQGPIQHVVVIFKENHRHKAWLNRAAAAVREQFLESDIPAYFAYARQFTLCDNYFTDIAGPSTPDHLMLLTADSPIIDNPSGKPVYDLPSLPSSLDAAGLTWGNYGGYVFAYIKAVAGRPQLPPEQFAKDSRHAQHAVLTQ